MLSKLIDFVTRDIWRLRLKNYTPAKSFLIKQLRVIILAVRGYAEDKCKFRASALTFYTLLSIVPVLAMIFGIAKGFGFEESVKAQIRASLQGQTTQIVQPVEQQDTDKTAQEPDTATEEAKVDDEIQPGHEQRIVAEKIIGFSESLLAETKGGFVAGIGIVFLFWTVIKVLGNIENSFNDIWGVKKPRRFGRKFSDYLSMMLICPVMLVVSSSITIAISSQIRETLDTYTFFQAIGPAVEVLLKLLPYCTLWILFSFVFVFMPNTKVQLRSGILAGVVAGTMLQIAQWALFSSIIVITKYNKVYGGFASLPLFFIWFQISWLIVLFGAELAFAHQNVDTYEFEQDCLRVSHSYKRLLSLLVMQLIIKNFTEEKQPLDETDISHKLEIPIRLIRQIIFELVESSIASEVISEEQEKVVSYQPGRDIDILTVKYIVDALEERGYSDIPVIKSPELDKLSGCIQNISAAIQDSPENLLLKDI